jgi:cysteinyl-tRNA synthetase
MRAGSSVVRFGSRSPSFWAAVSGLLVVLSGGAACGPGVVGGPGPGGGGDAAAVDGGLAATPSDAAAAALDLDAARAAVDAALELDGSAARLDAGAARGPDAEASPDAGAARAPDAASSPDGAAPSDAAGPATLPDAGPAARGGIPTNAPWLAFYGSAAQMGDLSQAAATFRLFDIDADPDLANFTPDQIAMLRAGGRNVVLSYLNVGSCEHFRSYWSSAPNGFIPCGANIAAQLGPYAGYPDEVWMNPANPDYANLIVNDVAPRLAATGVDGFFLDNLEIVEHGADSSNGPCDTACSQGGLDLVYALRAAFPNLVIVMQNATGTITRGGTTHGVPFPALLDGLSHEEVYAPSYDASAETELLAWQALGLDIGGHPLSITTEDYVGACDATGAAQSAYAASRAHGFSPYATISSADQNSICYWPF